MEPIKVVKDCTGEILASKFHDHGNHGNEGKFLDLVAATGVSDIRHDTQEVKADIRDSIETEGIRRNTERLQSRIDDSRKEAIIAGYEGRLESRDTHDKYRTELRLVERNLENRFLDIERKMDATREKELSERINNLNRDQQTAAIIAAFKEHQSE